MTKDGPLDAVGVVTCGRLGFTETFKCLFLNQAKLMHGVRMTNSPYWDQSLTRVVQSALETKAKYLLFFDGDGVWTNEDIYELYNLIENEENVDSIWPVQADRFGSLPLVYNWKFWEPTSYDYKQPVMRAWHGHFGLTFIKAQVFHNMNKPWFWSQPATDGSWDLKPGKLDADTYFWAKLHENQKKTGHVCLQANRTVIGHMELCIRWQCGDKVIAQTVPDFYAKGKPYGLRAPMLEETGDVSTQQGSACVTPSDEVKYGVERQDLNVTPGRSPIQDPQPDPDRKVRKF